jgi:hypothetical protein
MLDEMDSLHVERNTFSGLLLFSYYRSVDVRGEKKPDLATPAVVPRIFCHVEVDDLQAVEFVGALRALSSSKNQHAIK